MTSIPSKCIMNFRDVAISTNSSVLLKGRIFRSARLDDADKNDLHTLVNDCNICTVIDLRTSFEANSPETLRTAFPRALISNPMIDLFDSTFTAPSEHSASANNLPNKIEKVKPNSTAPEKIRRTFNIDLMGKEYRMKAVWGRASFKIRLIVVLYMMFFMKRSATSFISKNVIEKNGLLGLYKDLVDFCKPQILTALKVILAYADEPFLIHCSHGKDRTGIITAFVLSIVGVPREDIVSDYGTTSKLLSPFQDQIDSEFEKVGLSRDFASAREETMDSLLTYIETKYGSVLKYLENIGFDQSRQDALRAKLMSVEQDIQQ